MDYLVINEMSVERQASSAQHADVLMLTLANTLKSLAPIRQELLVHEDICNRHLSIDQTVHKWLFGKGPRDLRNLLMTVFRKGPYLETFLRDVQHTCHVGDGDEQQPADGSGLAGAAHFCAILVSFAESKQFPCDPVTVWYGEKGEQPTARKLRHAVNEDDVRRLRRWYEAHSKKHHTGNSVDSHHAPMDLKDEIAQQVLDRAVSVPGEKRMVGLHEGRFYVFHAHRIEENTYHGFRMAESEVEQKLPKHYQLLRQASPIAQSLTHKG